jgi:hypothetical protein
MLLKEGGFGFEHFARHMLRVSERKRYLIRRDQDVGKPCRDRVAATNPVTGSTLPNHCSELGSIGRPKPLTPSKAVRGVGIDARQLPLETSAALSIVNKCAEGAF